MFNFWRFKISDVRDQISTYVNENIYKLQDITYHTYIYIDLNENILKFVCIR